MSTLTQEELQAASGGSLVLRGYQVDGVNWLRRCHRERHGAILADEMGLGKTCQTIAFLLSLLRCERVGRPFLVLAPLSVTHNWRDEMKRMCEQRGDRDDEVSDDDDDEEEEEEKQQRKDFSVIVYVGDMEKRAKLQDRINTETFHLLLTTYELCLRDAAFLRRTPWSVLVVDEGHRLKSQSSLLHQALLEFDIQQRVLLTGTPVQNNLAELYSLLSFVAPDTFSPEGLRAFVQRFASVGSDEGCAAELGDLLGPFVLRRLKTEVASELPAKTELVLYHGVSALQKQYYRAILSRDLEAIEDPATGSRLRLMNILMQLRKCVNHPYLFNGAEPEPFEEGEHLVSASGKLLLLDRILALLHPEGHRVLVFSQMTRMLDILQDFLEFRGYSYERLDGSVRGEERHLAIKSFGQKDIFVFLLSTRAGGVGLNLTAADTVVFVDSDFNPQNDMQAAARAHRIGQTRPVKVIRLIGRSTVEEVIYRRAEAKLRLTHAVTAQMREDNDSNDLKDESPKQLSEILLAGLGTLMESDEGSSVEMDLQGILGESRNGCWVIEEPAAADHSRGLSRRGVARETDDDRRILESMDYLRAPVSAADRSTLALLRRESDTKAAGIGGSAQHSAAPGIRVPSKRLQLSPRERAERKRRREELAKERDRALVAKKIRHDAKRQNKKLMYWIEAGYDSLNVELPSEGDASESDQDDDEEDNEEEGRQIRYVLGDVTMPDVPEGWNAIVVHCVDNSGRWGRGGLFSALDKRSTQPKYRYVRAGEMGDLTLGDAHLIPLDDRVSRKGGVDMLVLIVAQSRDRNNVLSGISLAALEMGLERVRVAARKLHACVHLPRIGHATPEFNWYATERLVRKYLVSRGIPTYIYYYPRKTQQGVTSAAYKTIASTSVSPTAASKPGPSTSSAYSKPARAASLSPSPSSPSRPSPRPASSAPLAAAAASLGELSASGSRPRQSEPWALGFPDFMSGVRAYFWRVPNVEEARLARYLITFDGDVSKSVGADTTHVVTAGGEGETTGLSAETLRDAVARFPDLTVVTAAWLQACFCARKKLACAPYIVKI